MRGWKIWDSWLWPPEPIRTERLVLREPEARDWAAFIELHASPEVNAYLGGPRPRDELERELPEVPARRPGNFVVELDGAMIGQILLRRATGHSRPAAVGKADLGDLLLPRAWGFGYVAEACAAALDWFDGVLPGEPVVLSTLSANAGSMRLAAKLGSPRSSASKPGTPNSGSAYARPRRPAELVTESPPRLLDAGWQSRPSRLSVCGHG